ncbi:hypothetical protein [Streptomyces sp. NPDC057939]|uniref:hypothetical protein n=1 Tax=Streptomyces sp. NPDC057939 TaxID=3346284 RepID=UPI0036E37873
MVTAWAPQLPEVARHLVLAGVAEIAGDRDAFQAALGIPLRVCWLNADLATLRTRLHRRHEGDHDIASLPWCLYRAGELRATPVE